MENFDITHIETRVPNEFWNIGSDTLLVMLPGVGYTNQMPLMFYIHELGIARRWDVLQVNYDYRGMPGTDEERIERLTVDCRAALDAAIAESRHTKVILAGKSLGTILMTALLRSGIGQDLTTLWLTPLIRLPEVREAMASTAAGSAVVIGTRDDHYDAAFLEELRGRGTTVEVVNGGDHSLDVEAGVVESIGSLREVVQVLDSFLIG